MTGSFYDFPLTFKDFICIHEYANKLICIPGHVMKGSCLFFNLVPSLVVYVIDKSLKFAMSMVF